jgi:hypothetical protein
MEASMNAKVLSIAAAAALLIGATAIVQAQTRSSPGASGSSSGPAMQQHGTRGFAPGREGTTGAGDRDDRRGDRAGRLRGDDDDRTTGFGGRDDRLRGDREDQLMDSDTRGIDKE